jgi:hypothetical protein
MAAKGAWQVKSILDQWIEFWNQVAPQSAPVEQHREMKLAYFAGFYSALCCLRDGVGPENVSPDAGAVMIERLHLECEAFFRDLIHTGIG